jgi:hypothetical protein
VCVCVCMHVHVYIYTFSQAALHSATPPHACVCECVCLCVSVCVDACTCTYLHLFGSRLALGDTSPCVCVCVCVYIYMSVCIYIHLLGIRFALGHHLPMHIFVKFVHHHTRVPRCHEHLFHHLFFLKRKEKKFFTCWDTVTTSECVLFYGHTVRNTLGTHWEHLLGHGDDVRVCVELFYGQPHPLVRRKRS